MLAALDQAGDAGGGPAGLLPGPPAPTGWPVRLAAALAALPERVVLVVDNADSLTSRELTGALDLLVRHAGASCGWCCAPAPIHCCRCTATGSTTGSPRSAPMSSP